jgi:hypothetical protein
MPESQLTKFPFGSKIPESHVPDRESWKITSQNSVPHRKATTPAHKRAVIIETLLENDT